MEVPTYKLITPSIVSERLKVRGSLARRALIELMEKGLIKQVVAHCSQMIYTRMIGDEEEDDKEAEGGVVVEKKGKGKKDKQDAKAQAKAEAAAEAAAWLRRRARARRTSRTPRRKPRPKPLPRPSKPLKHNWFQNFRQCNQYMIHVSST